MSQLTQYANRQFRGDAVPDYRTCGPDTRVLLDGIIAAAEQTPLDQFGREVIVGRQDIAAQIIAAMQNTPGSSLQAPLDACAAALENLDLPRIQLAVQQVIQATKNNPKTAAAAAGGLLLGMPLVTAAAAAFAAVSHWKNRRKEQATGPDMSPDAIADRIRNAALTLEVKKQDLEWALQNTPPLTDQIGALARSNSDQFHETTLYLAAGTEILTRLQEQQAQLQDEEPGFDRDESLREVGAGIDDLEYQLTALGQCRTGAVESTGALGMMTEAIRTAKHAVQSLLQQELPAAMQNLATAGLALETWKTGKTAAAMRATWTACATTPQTWPATRSMPPGAGKWTPRNGWQRN